MEFESVNNYGSLAGGPKDYVELIYQRVQAAANVSAEIESHGFRPDSAGRPGCKTGAAQRIGTPRSLLRFLIATLGVRSGRRNVTG